jgi:hypothetical protein
MALTSSCTALRTRPELRSVLGDDDERDDAGQRAHGLQDDGQD